MRREGSPWQGLGAVTLKELADHLSSARMRVLEILIAVTAIAVLFFATKSLLDTTAEDPYLLLKLFTVGNPPMPSLVGILGFMLPLMAIGLGFDSINGEHNRRTLSRILAQPIYRDALLAGKFLAGLATLAIALLSLWLLVIGAALVRLGVPPGGEEIARSLVFLAFALAYAGVWLALAMLLSIVFRSPATAALVALGVWLLMSLLWPMIVPGIAQMIAPPDPRLEILGFPTLATLEWTQALSRLSPNQLFAEAVRAILSPATRSLGPIFLDQMQGAINGAPLPFAASVAIAWPQAVALIAGTIVLFVASYVVFQRQEVRA
jgi:ABC-2 type transport system permease protein